MDIHWKVITCLIAVTLIQNIGEGLAVSVQNVRLVNNGSSLQEGRLEVLMNGVWGTVCDDGFLATAARVVCRMLGLQTSGAVSYQAAHFGRGNGSMHLNNVQCIGNETHLNDCLLNTDHNCSHDEDVGVSCGEARSTIVQQVRLANGSSPEEGRLEVMVNGVWGSVCDDNFLSTSAQVVCRMLGLQTSGARTYTVSRIGRGSGSIHMDDVMCIGNETHLNDCPFQTDHDCTHSEDVGVICADVLDRRVQDVRLVNGLTPQEGRVEVMVNGVWGTVCDDRFGSRAARVVCRMLEFPASGAIAYGATRFGSGIGLINLDDVICFGNETHLDDCQYYTDNDCSHREDVGIICGDMRVQRVRLVNGSNPEEGRLEVYVNGIWGTVCDDRFSQSDARVVCRMLGFSTRLVQAVGRAHFGRGNGSIHLDEVQCIGNETDLDDCQFNTDHNCFHSEDVGVRCGIPLTNPNTTTRSIYVQLFGGDTANQGRVTALYSETGGRVCHGNWTDNDAKVVCSMLGYQRSGSRASAAGTFIRGIGRIWLDVPNCRGNETSLIQCPTFNGWATHECSPREDAGVICSTGSSLDNFLIVTDSRHQRIYRMDLSTFSYTVIPHASHEIPIAVGYDHIERTLYWSDVRANYIKKSNLDGSNSTILLRLTDNAVPDGIAVDPISRNLFFTDTGTNRITVCRLDQAIYKHIITSGLDEPRGIAVHPGMGYMFWTDWSARNPKIEKSKMDGSGRTVIVTSNIRWPNGIAIDYSANRLYWVDGSMDNIQKADFNGGNRVTIFTELGQLFGLALSQDYIYYTDWRESQILRIHKNGEGRTTVGPAVFGRLNGLLTYKSGEGIEMLNATNGCTIARGNCSHICVPMPNNTIKCLCPGSMVLAADGMTCISASLIVSTNTTTNTSTFVRLVGGSTANQGRVEVYYRTSFGTVCNDNWDVNDAKVICSMLGYQRTGSRTISAGRFARGNEKIWLDEVNCRGNETSIAQCPASNGWGVHDCAHSQDAGVICPTASSLDNFLIVTDTRHRHIYRMDLSTFSYTEIPHVSHSNPIAVGYDHIERTLYWSDVVAKYIKKSNLDGSNSTILLRLPRNAVPDGIAVDPISRNFFFTDTGTNTITVSRLDGSAHKRLITSGLDEPRGIAVHPGIGYIFWTDWSTRNPKIEKSKMDGSGRTTLVTSNLKRPNGIAIDYSANVLYWVDGSRDFIQKADFNGRNKVTIFREDGQLFGLALLQDYIYYTDWRESNILRIHKTGRDRIRVGPPVFGRLNGLLAYKSGEGIEMLNATNGCTHLRGNCSHICVPMPNNTIVCLCPDRMTLDPNGKICVPDPIPILINTTVRLVKGRTPYEGRVEVYHAGRWGTICDDSWSAVDARVICRMLGFSGGIAICCASFGHGSGTIWLDNVGCTGLERDIAACSHNPWGSHNCYHDEDAGVRCNGGGVTFPPIPTITTILSSTIRPSTTIRLVRGDTRYEGRVEIYHSGRWGTVCDDSWSNNDARVVCRMLGYSGGNAVCCAAFGSGSGTIWLTNVGCTGIEKDITYCRHSGWGVTFCHHGEDAGVRCSGSPTTPPSPTPPIPTPSGAVRLVGGRTPYEGRVEVYYSGRWGTICDDSWSIGDARVVCRMLGYSGGIAVCCARFGRGSGTIWLDDVGCVGHEADIVHCAHRSWGFHNCGHSEDAGVRCTGGLSTLRPLPPPRPVNTIRLVRGRTRYEGRVEIYHNGRWGTICDDSWSTNDARVVCRMLGYSGGTAVCCAEFGPGSGNIWLDEVSCVGSEADIIYCGHRAWGVHNCGHSEDAGVRCGGDLSTPITPPPHTPSPPPLYRNKVRLANGHTPSEGRVEIYHSSRWGTICDDGWTNSDARVVCRMLGYSGGTAVCCAGFGRGFGTIWLDSVGCSGTEADIGHCGHGRWGSHNCVHAEDAGVRCTDGVESSTPVPSNSTTQPSRAIRLVGGDSPYEGRVEVYHSGSWGTICDNSWSNTDARVVCRTLGYSGGSAFCCAKYGPGSGTIWLDNVACRGSEAEFARCSHKPWGVHNCMHDEDASVRCNGGLRTTITTARPRTTIRLIEGQSPSHGRVEIYHSGTWGTVCDNGWITANAIVVCRMLGYSGGTPVCCANLGAGSGRIWLDNVRCFGNETDIADCRHSRWGLHSCNHDEDAGVHCHELEDTTTPSNYDTSTQSTEITTSSTREGSRSTQIVSTPLPTTHPATSTPAARATSTTTSLRVVGTTQSRALYTTHLPMKSKQGAILNQQDSSGLSSGGISGIVVALCLIVIAVSILLFIIMRIRRRRGGTSIADETLTEEREDPQSSLPYARMGTPPGRGPLPTEQYQPGDTVIPTANDSQEAPGEANAGANETVIPSYSNISFGSQLMENPAFEDDA